MKLGASSGDRRCRRPKHPLGWRGWKTAHGEGGRRLRRWPARSLQRRIFLWLGATILFAGLVVGMLVSALSPSERMRQDHDGFAHFVSGRMETVWDNPAARDEFVRDLHLDLQLDATLFDPEGRVLSRHGNACAEAWGAVALERSNGEALGRLEVCGQRYAWHGWRMVLVLFVALAILWAASGILARRLFRPLRRLEQMAQTIAKGDLSARSSLDPARHGELGVLGATMDEMAARIEKQLADQRELLAAVSHELRTPLGHLRLLLEMAAAAPGPETLQEMEQEVVEIDALVGQLLASSRVDFGTLQAEPVDPVELATRALDRAGLSAELLRVEGDSSFAEADATLLLRALANLIGNAEQHGHGLAGLLVRFETEQIVFAIDDTGPGFGEGERDKVFAAFYRGEHRAGASLGLGLSLVRRIAEGHGGRAWVEDLEPNGARVAFSISAV